MKRSVTIRLSLALAVFALGAASAPAGALAAGPAAPAVHPGRIHVALSGLFSVHGASVTVPERAVAVAGTVQRYAPGQHLTLIASVDGHQFRLVRLSLGRRGAAGHFATTLRVPRPGHVSVRVGHDSTSRLTASLTCPTKGRR